MKHISAIIPAALVFASFSAHAGLSVINLTVGGEIQPGVYGQVQIGNQPPPPVFLPKPTIVHRPATVVESAPIYLHVPPGHAKKWSKHCQKYNACDRPVYFVKSAEYEEDEQSDERGRMDKDRKHKDRHDEGRGDEHRKGHGDKGKRGRERDGD